jgi:Phosphatidylinositol 3- and 4-kinase
VICVSPRTLARMRKHRIHGVCTLLAYDPDEARDSTGKWTDTGGQMRLPGMPRPEKSQSTSSPIESKLRTSSVKSQEELGGDPDTHSATTVLMTLEDGTRAVFKPDQDPDDELMKYGGRLRYNITPGMNTEREAAAWEVAKLVGMDDLVAPAVIRDVDGARGVMLAYQDGNVAKEISRDDRYDGQKDLARAAVFDYIIGNEDRNGGNWIVDDIHDQFGKYKSDDQIKLHLIDHGLAFPDDGKFGDAPEKYNFINRAAEEHIPYSGTQFASRYASEWPKISKALSSLGLPQSSIDGVNQRITAVAEAKDWTDLPGTDGYRYKHMPVEDDESPVIPSDDRPVSIRVPTSRSSVPWSAD